MSTCFCSHLPYFISLNVCVRIGADLSDYFNYGFNEDTWKAYCEKQKRLRMGLEVSAVSSVTSKITVRDQCLLRPCFFYSLLFPHLSVFLLSTSLHILSHLLIGIRVVWKIFECVLLGWL